jgi:hypothetical protein
VLQWVPVVLAGILIIIAFVLAPSLLLPPPSRPHDAPPASPHQLASTAVDSPPEAPAQRADETQATKQVEQPSPTDATRPKRKRASPPTAEAPADHPDDHSSDANVRWTQ